jgi:hypothetical protein
MRRMRPLVVASLLLGWLAAARGYCADGSEGLPSWPQTPPLAAASSPLAAGLAAPLDSWRQTRQGWQRCQDFLGPPIEYRCPALHPAVVGILEVLLSVTAMLALGRDRRQMTIRARRASEAAQWSPSPSGRGPG